MKRLRRIFHNKEIEVIWFAGTDTPQFDEALSIREIVFVGEQQVPKELEYDGKDQEAFHFLLITKKHAIGTCRYRTTSDGIKLERFAILKQYREQGYGAILMEKIMEYLTQKNLPIFLNAQEEVIDFYSKYSFTGEGEKFFEAGIRHLKMRYKPE